MSKPIDILLLESSIYNLTKKCNFLCFDNTKNIDFQKIINLKDDELYNFEKYYYSCVRDCANNYIKIREIIKSKLLTDIDNVMKKNDAIYKDFYN